MPDPGQLFGDVAGHPTALGHGREIGRFELGAQIVFSAFGHLT